MPTPVSKISAPTAACSRATSRSTKVRAAIRCCSTHSSGSQAALRHRKRPISRRHRITVLPAGEMISVWTAGTPSRSLTEEQDHDRSPEPFEQPRRTGQRVHEDADHAIFDLLSGRRRDRPRAARLTRRNRLQRRVQKSRKRRRHGAAGASGRRPTAQRCERRRASAYTIKGGETILTGLPDLGVRHSVTRRSC